MNNNKLRQLPMPTDTFFRHCCLIPVVVAITNNTETISEEKWTTHRNQSNR